MLLKFGLKNFRSFKDYAEINLSSNKKNENLAQKDKYSAQKLAGIFGANASGKSNFIDAFFTMLFLIQNSGEFKKNDEILLYEPFAFSNNNTEILFKVNFILNRYKTKETTYQNIKFTYKFTYNRYKIIHESLYFYPKGQKALLFLRQKDKFTFGSYFSGAKNLIISSLLPNQLFLSKSAMFDIPILTNVYSYFEKNLKVVFKDLNVLDLLKNLNIPLQSNLFDVIYQMFLPQKIAKQLEDESFTKKINALIASFDIGIKEIFVKEKNDTNFIEQLLKVKYDIISKHRGRDRKTVDFKFSQESLGTQWLFILGATLLDALDNGTVLFIDEFEKNLHPHITRFIVDLFNSKEFNKNNSQLIFATHDINLLDADILTKEQIWFAEKNQYGESELFSLSDFEGIRKNTPFNKWYLSGRFGAVPQIDYSKFFEIFNK